MTEEEINESINKALADPLLRRILSCAETPEDRILLKQRAEKDKQKRIEEKLKELRGEEEEHLVSGRCENLIAQFEALVNAYQPPRLTSWSLLVIGNSVETPKRKAYQPPPKRRRGHYHK